MTNIGNKSYHTFDFIIPQGQFISESVNLRVRESFNVRRYYITPSSLLVPDAIDGTDIEIQTSIDGVDWRDTFDLFETALGSKVSVAGQRFMFNPMHFYDTRFFRLRVKGDTTQAVDRAFTLTASRVLPR